MAWFRSCLMRRKRSCEPIRDFPPRCAACWIGKVIKTDSESRRCFEIFGGGGSCLSDNPPTEVGAEIETRLESNLFPSFSRARFGVNRRRSPPLNSSSIRATKRYVPRLFSA